MYCPGKLHLGTIAPPLLRVGSHRRRCVLHQRHLWWRWYYQVPGTTRYRIPSTTRYINTSPQYYQLFNTSVITRLNTFGLMPQVQLESSVLPGMFIKSYQFLIEKKGKRFVYICTSHQVKNNYRLKEQKGRESMSSRHELQKHEGISTSCDNKVEHLSTDASSCSIRTPSTTRYINTSVITRLEPIYLKQA